MATPNNFRVKSGLNVGTTIAGGNTTITGFANVSTSVNSASLTVGSSFIANTSKVAIGTAVGLEANGGIGTAGQVLHSNGTSIYWAADDGITSIATANGLSGGTITTTGTLGVTTGSTLTVNTAGIHVNSALSITSLALAGAASGITTLAAGNTTITGFANVTTTLQVGGNTTITGNTTSMLIVGTDVDGVDANSTVISVGNTTVFTTVNSTAFSGTANNATNFGGSSLATVQGQITGNAATAYTNAVSYTDTKIGTANTAMVANAGAAYTNAIAIAANGSNITSGTVAFARLPSLFIGTTTIQSTSAAQAVSGITTLAAGNTTITGDITVSGNLTINGTTTNINSTNLVVEDKNIVLADVTTPTDVTADGGGITLKGATDKTFNWVDATDSWTSSEHLDIATGKTYRINGTTIANSTALGTGILASSLTSVGTLSSLTLAGAVSGITTLAAGNTTITGFANVTSTIQGGSSLTIAGAASGITTLAAGNTTHTGWVTASSARGAVAAPTAGQNNSALYVTGSDTAYGLLFGTDSATGKGWIQSQRTDGTATTYNLRLNPTGSGIESGNTTITGFANVSVSVNSALFTVGTTATINSTSLSVVGGTFVANAVGISVAGSIAAACSSFIANSTGITSTGFANVSTTLQVGGISTLAANLVMANNNITRPVLTGYTEAEVSNTAVSGTWIMDCAAANFFDLTLTGNITISPTNVPPATRVWSGTIAAKQATYGATITWPSGIKWPGGSAPPATITSGAIDIWSLMTYDGGTTWVGSLSVKNVA